MTENQETTTDQATTNNPEGKPVEANLLQFFSGMAMQTLMHLGLMTNPLTQKMEPNLVQAKYSIDILGILQEKTQGNLTDEEEGYLTAMLAELRMQYVNSVSQPQEPEEAAQDAAEKEHPSEKLPD
ncbi:MAG: DUF1844 domain-containing protein [Planctomycetes bacterium]|nr:DUF1844 domain-containing protein [Planctomycetota bacterium]